MSRRKATASDHLPGGPNSRHQRRTSRRGTETPACIAARLPPRKARLRRVEGPRPKSSLSTPDEHLKPPSYIGPLVSDASIQQPRSQRVFKSSPPPSGTRIWCYYFRAPFIWPRLESPTLSNCEQTRSGQNALILMQEENFVECSAESVSSMLLGVVLLKAGLSEGSFKTRRPSRLSFIRPSSERGLSLGPRSGRAPGSSVAPRPLEKAGEIKCPATRLFAAYGCCI